LESLKEREHLEDLGVDYRIKLNEKLRKKNWERAEWFHLGQDTDRYHAVLNTLMNHHQVADNANYYQLLSIVLHGVALK
jgi:hypothetical protein